MKRFLKLVWYYSFWLWVRIALSWYFSKIKISGKENLVKDAPMIWGANHENALIDPLIKTTRFPLMIHYLVRADVFKNPIVKWFLNSLNLMPVYRIRDGVNSIKANEVIFRNCFEAFKKGEHLILYPEASHDPRRQRKVAKKGIARIALGAMHEPDAPEKLYIVPVGTNYSRHKWFRSSMHVVFGEPIEIKKIPETNENIDKLRLQYEEASSKCCVSFSREKFEILDKVLLHDLNPEKILVPSELNAKAKVIEDKITEEQTSEILDLAEKMNHEGLAFPFERRKYFFFNLLAALTLLPLVAVGTVLNLPTLLIGWKIMSGIKDKVYNDTIYFGVGLLLSTFAFWLTVGISWSLTGLWWVPLVAAVFFYFSLISIGEFRRQWILFKTNWKFTRSKNLASLYERFVKLTEQVKAL